MKPRSIREQLQKKPLRRVVMALCACATAVTAWLPHGTGMLYRSVDERTFLLVGGMMLTPVIGLRFLHRAYRDKSRLPALLAWSGYVTAVTVLSVAHATQYRYFLSVLVLSFCLLIPYVLGILGLILTGRMAGLRAERKLS